MNKNFWTEEQILFLKENYSNFTVKMHIFEEKFQKSRSAISKKAFKLKLNKRKTPINSKYFDFIDTWEKAYILGWLWTDGCNKTKTKDIAIEIIETDKQILEFIKNQIEYKGNIKTYKRKTRKNGREDKLTSVLYFRDKNISEKLESYGMIANKSLFLEFPNIIPEIYKNAFILGAFEGDGSISINKNGLCSMNYIGTYDMCKNIQDILVENTGINKVKIRKVGNNSFSFSYGGLTNLRKISNYIYKDAKFFLKRKHDKFQKC